MNRKAVGVLGVLVVFGGGLMLANKGAFVTQVVETEGHRTTEYGLFGGSWPLKREAVPDLKVQEDVVAHLGAVAPWPAQLDASKTELSMRIRRPGGNEWYAKPKLSGDPAKVIDHYQKHLRGGKITKTPDMLSVVGTGADGSDVWIWCSVKPASATQECGFMVTSRFK